jgi:hypothetical protein
MPEKTNNPMKRQRPEHESDAWTPPTELRAVSLKAIADLLDTTRSSARRWLREAGVQPISLGRGAKGAIRYRWSEVEAWLKTRSYVE